MLVAHHRLVVIQKEAARLDVGFDFQATRRRLIVVDLYTAGFAAAIDLHKAGTAASHP